MTRAPGDRHAATASCFSAAGHRLAPLRARLISAPLATPPSRSSAVSIAPVSVSSKNRENRIRYLAKWRNHLFQWRKNAAYHGSHCRRGEKNWQPVGFYSIQFGRTLPPASFAVPQKADVAAAVHISRFL